MSTTTGPTRGPSRADGDTSWRKAAAGPPPGDDRGNARFGGRSSGGGNGGGGGAYRRNDNRGSTGPPSGERPRLNLKKKGEVEGDAPDLKDEKTLEEKTRREPEKINPRAAAFGDAPSGRSNMQRKPDERRERDNNLNSDRGPPPVQNSRFAKLAEEEQQRDRDRDRERGDNRDNRRPMMDRGPPPPVANSRFAAAAEADRSRNPDPYNRNDRGPPPVANSRFAAAAEADRSRNPEPFNREERGPPPVANSRFAAAAAMAEQENVEREERRRDRDQNYRDGGGFRGGGRGFDRDQGPPPMANSRFALAAAADRDYQERGDRDGDDRGRGYGGGRGYDDRRGGFGGRGRGGFGSLDNLPRGPRSVTDDLPRAPRASAEIGGPQPGSKKLDNLLKAKAPPREDNILKLPVDKLAPEHAANVLTMPTKKKDDDAKAEPEKEKEPEKAPEPEPEPEAAPAQEGAGQVSEEEQEKLLAEFASGNKQGEDLKAWVEENSAKLPSVEKLLFYFLEENQKLNPDPECAWAEPDKWGAALNSLVEDNLHGQMQVLWAIQKYCDKLGFPKLNDEAVVQSMFRAMYKYDLALDDAFEEWKEDVSEEHEQGKINAVIQTVKWFEWLEEDDEEDEEEEGAEEEEHEEEEA